MKNRDLQTLDMLKAEFDKSIDSAKVPLKLQKQSIVNMLERDAEKHKAQAEEAANKKYQVVTIRKLMAIAAMLAVVVAGTLVMRTGSPSVALNIISHESGNVLNSGESYGKIFEDIVFSSGAPSVQPSTTNTQPSANTENIQQTPALPIPSTTQHILSGKEDILAGYVYVEPTKPAVEQSADSSFSELQPNSSEGDFEADIVKANGDYLYVLTSGLNEKTNEAREVISIVKIVPDNQMQVISEIPLYDGNKNGRIDECLEIYLKNNCLITVCNSRNFSTVEDVYSDNAVTVAAYYDIANPAAPKKIHEHVQDGEYISSKICGNKLYLVTSTTFSDVTDEAAAESMIPGTLVDGEQIKVAAENIFYDKKNVDTKSFTYVTVTDVSKLSKPTQFAFLGGGKDVSCHSNTIIVSRNFVKTNEVTGAAENCTFVYRFNVDGSAIIMAVDTIEMNGVVVGGLSVDEKTGYLKTVTLTDGGYNVYVHDQEMKCIDSVEDILSGETVKAVKYIGNRVYLVYGRNGEKTGVVDFSKELKAESIVSVSTATLSNSLYEITDSVILGIGINHESNAENGNAAEIVLTLFDFSNPENFKNTDTYELPDSCKFAAGNDGRCVMIDSDKMIFGIPVIKKNAETNTDVSSYLIFSVDGGKITPVGECEHDDAVVGDAAVRSVCVGDTIYTVSGEKIVSHSAEDYKEISRVEF